MNRIDLSSLRSIDAIRMTEKFSSTSSETQNAEKSDVSMMSQINNTVRKFEHVSSWKYKNPFSVSVSDPIPYEKFSHNSGKCTTI